MSTSKTSAASWTATYSPLGCNQPLMTHLTKGAREQIRKLAAEEMRSMSATARMLIIEGMERRANQPE